MHDTKSAHRRDMTYENHLAWERIGRRVFEVRMGRSMSGRELGRVAGLTQDAVESIEKGNSVPLMAVVRIAKALGIKVDELIPEDVLS